MHTLPSVSVAEYSHKKAQKRTSRKKAHKAQKEFSKSRTRYFKITFCAFCAFLWLKMIDNRRRHE